MFQVCFVSKIKLISSRKNEFWLVFFINLSHFGKAKNIISDGQGGPGGLNGQKKFGAFRQGGAGGAALESGFWKKTTVYAACISEKDGYFVILIHLIKKTLALI